uniref:Uncharacterized protein n=1 Tax=Erwinia amylovora ATCC BAA-2158 TaxID=889211 RepID=E5B594_ERWAM|nr:hypothetical protein predicted by Glimmer/Critica [Erwinia amylovora ATCC BAA-2158]
MVFNYSLKWYIFFGVTSCQLMMIHQKLSYKTLILAINNPDPV